MDEQAPEALTPERAAEILRALTPEQQQAVGLYVDHMLGQQGEQFSAHLKEQLRAQEERLNAEFLAELTKRTAPDESDDDDLYTSRDAVTAQVLAQAERLDEHDHHRALFAQHSDPPAAQLSVADVEEIAERVAQSVLRRLATPPDRVQGQPYVGTSTLQPQLTTPGFRRAQAYVPTLPIRR